jgi:O-antigen biosynthesis protein
LWRIGSGFVRSNDVLRAMVAAGARVTIFPMKAAQFPLSIVRAELPDTVEVMHDRTLSDLAEFLSTRRDCYDLLWIARTHNLDLIQQTLSNRDTIAAVPTESDGAGPVALLRQMLELDPMPHGFDEFTVSTSVNVSTATVTASGPGDAREIAGAAIAWPAPPIPRIIVDSEAVASLRDAEQAARLDRPFDLDSALREEFRNLDAAFGVVAVTEAEAEVIRTCRQCPVTVLGHTVAAAPTPRRFEERSGILFVGAIHGMDHPNWDGLAWFIDEVLPLIERSLRWETRLTVAGYTAPGVSLDRFKGHARVTLRGAVADLRPLYDAHRVFIAPARFAAGIPYKVNEAAAFGVPVVTTNLLSRQLGWPDMEVIGAADSSDPAGFAARVIALHRDAALWTRLREAALARVQTELDPRAFTSKVADLLRSSDASEAPNPGEI